MSVKEKLAGILKEAKADKGIVLMYEEYTTRIYTKNMPTGVTYELTKMFALNPVYTVEVIE